MSVHVLGLTTAARALEKQGIPCQGFFDYVNANDAEALDRGRELVRSLSGTTISSEESVAYLGLSYADLEQKLGVDGARDAYEKRGRQIFLPTSILERVFDRIQPDLLIATNSPRAERAAFLVAKRRSVPAVCLVDLFASDEIEWIKEPGFASRICVISEQVRKNFIDAGCVPHEVIVTGNPAFDTLGDAHLAVRAQEMRSQKGWATASKVILWASAPEPATNQFTGEPGDPTLPARVDQQLAHLARAHPDWRVVIRLHPSESRDVSCLGDTVELGPATDDLPTLLHAVDVVIVLSSTVGLQAAIARRPVVQLMCSCLSRSSPYVALGMACPAKDVDGLEQALVEVLSERWQPASPPPVPGQSTEKVLSVVDSLLGGSLR